MDILLINKPVVVVVEVLDITSLECTPALCNCGSLCIRLEESLVLVEPEEVHVLASKFPVLIKVYRLINNEVLASQVETVNTGREVKVGNLKRVLEKTLEATPHILFEVGGREEATGTEDSRNIALLLRYLVVVLLVKVV